MDNSSAARAAARKSLEVTLDMTPDSTWGQEASVDPSGNFPQPPLPPAPPSNRGWLPPPPPDNRSSQIGPQPHVQQSFRGVPEHREQVVVQTEGPRAPQSQFIPGKAKEMIGAILREKLTGAKYDADTAPLWVREITDAIKAQLKDMDLDRYKLVVQAVLGEQRGQGFQMSCRCFWDPNTDNYAHESFTNDSIFCVAGAFALYMY